MTARFGPANPMWTGDDASYNAVHFRLWRSRGRASEHLCACGDQAREWAYQHGDPDERQSRLGPYSVDLDRYLPKCVKCHRRLDRKPDFRPPMTKLTPRLVREIRFEWSTGEWRQRELAESFGVSLGTINRAILGQSWANEAGPTVRTRSQRSDAGRPGKRRKVVSVA